MNAPVKITLDPDLPQPIWQREYDLARECVRRSLTHDRQREHHAIYLDGDQVEYLRDLAAAERVEAREHIRVAKRAEARMS